MKCVDQEALSIWGDYNSAKAQEFVFKFKMCKGEGCESPEKIREWLMGKYIMLVYNSRSFAAEGFGEDTVISNSLLKYIAISSQTREIIPFKVEMTNLELHDNELMMLDELTWVKYDDLFKLH